MPPPGEEHNQFLAGDLLEDRPHPAKEKKLTAFPVWTDRNLDELVEAALDGQPVHRKL